MQIDDPASVLGCRASSAPQLAALKLTAYYSQPLVGGLGRLRCCFPQRHWQLSRKDNLMFARCRLQCSSLCRIVFTIFSVVTGSVDESIDGFGEPVSRVLEGFDFVFTHSLF